MKISIISSCFVIGTLGACSMGQDSNHSILEKIARVIDDSKQFGRDLVEFPEGMANVESVISLGAVLVGSNASDIAQAVSIVKDDAESRVALQIGLEQLDPIKYLSVLSSIVKSDGLPEDTKIAFLQSPDLYRHILSDNWQNPEVADLVGMAKKEISDPAFLKHLSDIESGVSKKRIDEYRNAVGGAASIIKIPDPKKGGSDALRNEERSEETASLKHVESHQAQSKTKPIEVERSQSIPMLALVIVGGTLGGILILLLRAFLRRK